MSTPSLRRCLISSTFRCIQNLTRFVQPILDGICAATGWKVSLIAGGPEPSQGGRLNVIRFVRSPFIYSQLLTYYSIHSGVTSGDVQMNFGRAEQTRYKQYIIPVFGDFLRKCYSKLLQFSPVFLLMIRVAPEECRAYALPAEADTLDGMDTEHVAVDSMPNVDTSSGHGPRRNTRDTVLTPEEPSPATPPLNSPSASDTATTENPFPSLIDERPGGGALYEGSIAAVPTATSDSTTTMHAATPLVQSKQGPRVQELDKGITSVNNMDGTARLGHLKRAHHETLCEGEDDQSAHRVSKRKHAVDSKAAAAVTKSMPSSRPMIVGASPSSAPPLSAAPPWFLSSHKLFSDKGLGKEWDELIEMWAMFEAKEGYKGVGRPTTSGRPEVVSQWISRARSVTWRPNILDIKGYEAKYNEWWKRLQPDWRVVNGKVDVGLTQGNWESLRLPGLNGFLSIIASLFYWGLGLQGEMARHNAWLSAVRDCHLVVSLLST